MKINLQEIKNDKRYLLLIIPILIFIIATITIVVIVKPSKSTLVPSKEEQETSELRAHRVYDENKDTTLVTVNAINQDHSAILVKDGALVTLRNSSITKYDGTISKPEDSERIGLNSAIVVSYDSELKITNTKIETSMEYTNGLYLSGKRAKVNMIESSINSYGLYNNGVVVGTNAEISMEHSTITTKFKYSPAIVVKDSTSKATLVKSIMLETNGSSSPLFESKGTIKMEDSTGTANGSRFAVLEGGKLTINKSTLIAAGANDNDSELPSGFLIKGKDTETTININDSSLNINSKMPYYNTASIFDVIDTKVTINLKNTQMNFGSKKIVTSTSSEITVNCDNQVLEGGFEIDKQSTLNISLKNDSILMGYINNKTDKNIKISLDSSSKLVLLEDTYIAELKNEDNTNSNINFNNHRLYVNGKIVNE